MDTTQFFLNPRSIRTHVPEPTFERGMSLYITQQVLDCTVNHSSTNEWEIEGTVQGSKREAYRVSAMVEVDPTGDLSFFKGDCSCPVGDNCKHAVALTVKAAFKSARPNTGLATSGGPAYYANAQPLPVAPSAQELQQKLEAQTRAALERETTAARQKVSQWLDLFGKDADTDAPVPAQDNASAAPAEEHVVYILTAERQGHLTLLNLGFGYSKRLRNGNWAKVKLPRYGQLYNASAQDTEIVRLIQSLGRNRLVNAYSAGDKAPLAGETGRLALELAANTGHLFDLSAERVLGTPIRLGAPRPVTGPGMKLPRLNRPSRCGRCGPPWARILKTPLPRMPAPIGTRIRHRSTLTPSVANAARWKCLACRHNTSACCSRPHRFPNRPLRCTRPRCCAAWPGCRCRLCSKRRWSSRASCLRRT